MAKDRIDNRIPTLDGWRAVAVMMVLDDHYHVFRLHEFASGRFSQHGVQLFFVLSGFLITTQLLAADRIDLKSFYIRRAFRILPPALFYLSVIAAIVSLNAVSISKAGIVSSLFFYRNYLRPDTTANLLTVQFWSLSMEEQFYFVWPAMLLFIGRRGSAIIAATIAAVIGTVRFFYWHDCIRLYRHTEVRADGLLIGCLLAFALRSEPVRAFINKHAPWIFGVCAIIVVIDCFRFNALIPTHESIALALVIASTAVRPSMMISRLLETSPFKVVGVLSYPIYIWQILFLNPMTGEAWPVLLAIAVLFSHLAVERPMREIGRSLAKRISRTEGKVHYATSTTATS